MTMKLFITILILFFQSQLIFSSASTRTPLENWPPLKFHLNDVKITIERTACFGTCPVYKIEICGDGNCTYYGIEYVMEKGERNFTIDPKRVLGLLVKFYRACFFDLRDRYKDIYELEIISNHKNDEITTIIKSPADLASTILTVQIGNYVKSVEDYAGSPPILKKLAEEVDKFHKVKPYD